MKGWGGVGVGGSQMGEVTSGGSLIWTGGLPYLPQCPPFPPPPLCKQALTRQTLIRVKQMGLLISKDKVEKRKERVNGDLCKEYKLFQ